jgi:hypothetical protein
MSLNQQRVLDAIDSDLQSGEPHLASMFSIFTRLTADEDKPLQETLPTRTPTGWRSRLRHMLTASRRRDSESERPGVPRDLPAA